MPSPFKRFQRKKGKKNGEEKKSSTGKFAISVSPTSSELAEKSAERPDPPFDPFPDRSNDGEPAKIPLSARSSRTAPVADALAKAAEESSSFLTRSSFFRRMVRKTFDETDEDDNGTIDKTEMFSAVLAIHLKIGRYVGAAACLPPSRELVDQLFAHYDSDESSTLDFDEYLSLVIVLCANITFRLSIQLMLLLLIVPYLAGGLLRLVILAAVRTATFVDGITEGVQDTVEDVWEDVEGVLEKSATYRAVAERMEMVGEMLPDWLTGLAEWETVPSMIATGIISAMLLPLCLDFIDSLFRRKGPTTVVNEEESVAKKMKKE